MKQKYKMSYLNTITTVICTVVIFAGMIGSMVLLKKVDVGHYDNRARILLSNVIRQIEKGNYTECEFPYVVFNLYGMVQYADSDFHLEQGNHINVQEMIQSDETFTKQQDEKYKEVFVLYGSKDSEVPSDAVIGFTVFLIPEEFLLKQPVFEQIMNGLIPLTSAILLVIIIMYIKTVVLNRRIFSYIRNISESAKHIIAGNYDYEVLRIHGTKVRNDEMGDLIYSFELMRDELRVKQIREEQLKKSQQELISCISHDLKTPISTIKAYSEGLRDGIAKTEETRKEYEDVIIKKTNLLNQMITELLEYSNAQLNQLDIKPVETYFLSYFSDVCKELKGYTSQRHVKMTYEADLQDRIVTIDCKRITEVLYNLVENSIKYTGDQPLEISITAVDQGEEILICVIDNGIGISSDDIPYVFDKFYRAEKSRTSSIPGSGLGLSICKFIVEAQGGAIYCKSRNGEGCEMGFTIH